MPEVVEDWAPPNLEDLAAAIQRMPQFTCDSCHVVIELEPRCGTCEKCVACCNCVMCDNCGVQTEEICRTCRRCRNRSPQCCRCIECDRCHEMRSQSHYCASCHLCREGCCICWTCGGCGALHTRQAGGLRPCRDCSRCLECCECRQMHFMAPMNPTFHLVPVGETDPRAEAQRIGPPPAYRLKNASHRFLSTEIEISGFRSGSNRHTARVIQKWKGAVVTDGSVSAGCELNTAPAAGDVFGAEIAEICEAIELDEGYAASNAGAHVHIDARDFRFYDIRRLVFLYEKIEDALYGLVAPFRRTSSYALPCGRMYSAHLHKGLVPKENKLLILKNMYNLVEKPTKNDMRRIKSSKGAGNRYHGLNLHSWMFRGTIECRIMHGSTSAEKLVNWGYLWAAILDAAMRMREADIEALRKKPIEIVLDIAPTDELKMWVENRWAFFHRNMR